MIEYIDPEIELIDFKDIREQGWRISRPYLKPEDEVDMREITRIDLSLNTLAMYYFKITSSVYFRELVTSIRPIFVWAQTSRVNPLHKVGVSGEYRFTEYSESQIETACIQLENGVPQDIARLELPLTHSTTYVVGMDFRTIISFCKTLEKIRPDEYRVYGTKLLNLLGYKPEDLRSFTFKDLASTVVIDKDEKLLGSVSKSLGDLTVMKTKISFSLNAQLVRHTQNRIKSELWTSEFDPTEKTLADLIDVVIYMPKSSYQGILSHRSCWLADWNLWSQLIGDEVTNLSDNQFKATLPCKSNCKNCPYAGDMEGRLNGKDPGIVCPIYSQDNSRMTEYINQFGRNPISIKFERCLKGYNEEIL